MRAFVVSLLLIHPAWAAPKQVAVFVALCDNATQGIVPVPARIGDGNKPDENLYWGCTDGFSGCFKASKAWKLLKREIPEDKRIFERLVYRHESGNLEVTAEAWRGSEIKACLAAFESALISGKHELCAYIGHNVLMDAAVDPPVKRAPDSCDAIVLCCMSERYFKERLSRIGTRPVMLTTQLMYPGAFILRDALPVWANGGSTEEIRAAGANAYSRNQKISIKSARGVFADLSKKPVNPVPSR
jgi:hypothetical protein